MKKIKKLQANGFYVLEGVNSANTHLIENQIELDQFFIFAEAHFRNYMTIYDYCITPVGWSILVRIKDEATIHTLYSKTQERRGKPTLWDETWLILSNQVRLFRSRMTKWTNKKRNREGNASKTTYRRYLFTSLDEGVNYIQTLRNQDLCFDQPNPKYQPNSVHFDETKEIEACSRQLSSKNAQEGSQTKSRYLPSLRICNYVVKYLEKWIKQTYKMHELRPEGVVARI